MLRSLKPDYCADNVFDIDFDVLSAAGVSFIIFDVDNTLMTYDRDSAPDEIREFVSGLKQKGFGACVLSNGHSERIRKIAEELDLDFIGDALKPLRRGFKRISAKYGTDPGCTVIIGDQLFTDVLGASRAGTRSVLVKPLKFSGEPLFVKIKRCFEKPVLRRIYASEDVGFFPARRENDDPPEI